MRFVKKRWSGLLYWLAEGHVQFSLFMGGLFALILFLMISEAHPYPDARRDLRNGSAEEKAEVMRRVWLLTRDNPEVPTSVVERTVQAYFRYKEIDREPNRSVRIELLRRTDPEAEAILDEVIGGWFVNRLPLLAYLPTSVR